MGARSVEITKANIAMMSCHRKKMDVSITIKVANFFAKEENVTGEDALKVYRHEFVADLRRRGYQILGRTSKESFGIVAKPSKQCNAQNTVLSNEASALLDNILKGL